MVTGVGRNAPVLKQLSEVHIQPYDTAVAKCLLPCGSYVSFKMFNISASEFGTVSICRWLRECADEFLATVNESVVHSEYKGYGWTIFWCNLVT